MTDFLRSLMLWRLESSRVMITEPGVEPAYFYDAVNWVVFVWTCFYILCSFIGHYTNGNNMWLHESSMKNSIWYHLVIIPSNILPAIIIALIVMNGYYPFFQIVLAIAAFAYYRKAVINDDPEYGLFNIRGSVVIYLRDKIQHERQVRQLESTYNKLNQY